MKRDMDKLNLRDAFKPMPEECHNALMTAARSVKEDESVKRVAFKTALIAACVVLATMTVAVAAGSLLGIINLNDFFGEYDTHVPEAVQEVMANTTVQTYNIGPVTLVVHEIYGDRHIVMTSTEVKPTIENSALVCGDDPYDSIASAGSSAETFARRLGVSPEMSWMEAAEQLNMPLYAVRIALELPIEVSADCMEEIMFSEEGNMTYFDIALFNSAVITGGSLDSKLYIRVSQVGSSTSEDSENVIKEYKELSIPIESTTGEYDYNVPDKTMIGDHCVLDSVHAEMNPSGLYLTAYLNVSEDISLDELEIDKLLSGFQWKQADGSDYPRGINLSSNIIRMDTWPMIKIEDLISVDQVPETIGLLLPDREELILLNLKR